MEESLGGISVWASRTGEGRDTRLGTCFCVELLTPKSVGFFASLSWSLGEGDSPARVKGGVLYSSDKLTYSSLAVVGIEPQDLCNLSRLSTTEHGKQEVWPSRLDVSSSECLVRSSEHCSDFPWWTRKKKNKKPQHSKLVHTYNPSAQDVETGGSGV